MSKVRVTLPPGEPVITGKHVTFTAPCDCSATECLQINGVDYSIVDSLGNNVAGQSNFWISGSLVLVILNVEEKKAYMQFASSITGNAATATKLQNARTIRTNLASTSTASFDGTKNVTPGVTGTLPVANGGTGKTSVTSGSFLIGNGTNAMTEKTPSEVRTAIGAAASSHNHSASNITSGTLPAERGGTGVTSIAALKTSLGAFYTAGTSAPSNTNLLWIDTNATTGGLKYYNGSAWVHVPVAYT